MMLIFKDCFTVLPPPYRALCLPGSWLLSLLLYKGQYREALICWYFWQYSSESSKNNLFHTSTCCCYRGATSVRAVQWDAEYVPQEEKSGVAQHPLSSLAPRASRSHTALTLGFAVWVSRMLRKATSFIHKLYNSRYGTRKWKNINHNLQL